MTGSSRAGATRRVNRHAGLIALALGLTPVGAPARAPQVSVPATTLDQALALLGRQTGADIISTEPGLAQVKVARLDGSLTPAKALARLLRGTGFHAVAIDPRSFRVVRDAPARPIAKPRRPIALPQQPTTDIVVTASKQRIPLLRYPGSLTTIDPGGIALAPPPHDMSDVSRTMPVLQNTELGPGRNKIFIRGIADSSFAGAAQSTATVYFGDVQLGFSGADPSIKLCDMAGIEVMEGPQGTLYGTGSIGGVIRLTPNPVDLVAVSGSVANGVTLTASGEPGFDVAGTFNLPLKTDAVGVRATAYRTRDGGYIDDRRRGLDNINRVDTVGGRGALAIDPGDDWRIDLSGLGQRIDGADGQYAERTSGELSRRSAVAQPFRNDIALGRAVVTKRWADGLELLSATGIAATNADDLFDATQRRLPGMPVAPPVTVYRTHGAKLLLTHEVRLSRSAASGSSWVAGLTLLSNHDSQDRSVGPPQAPVDIIGVTNVTRSASLFGERTFAIRPALALTVGLRGTLARTDGQPSFRPRSDDYIRGRSTRRLDPTLAFSWQLEPGLAVFGRVQSGYRTGGLAVARGVGRVADFRSDSILVGELGVRRLRQGPTGLALTAALSTARWTSIQADLINRRGLPYTDNIGNAHIQALEGNADWVPIRGLRGTLSFLYTHNVVSGSLADSSARANRRLPETPPFAATSTLGYEWAAGRESRLDVGFTASYIGRSVLGTGDVLDISQGRYATLGVSGGWSRRRFAASLTVDNAAEASGNRFASGDPLTFSARDQTTPLRPINVRLGTTLAF